MRHVPVTATVEATALTGDHGAPATHPTTVVAVTPIARPLSVSLDCSDPARLAEFWQQVVGGTIDAAYFRAGHAHAGVLMILAIIGQHILDQSRMRDGLL